MKLTKKLIDTYAKISKSISDLEKQKNEVKNSITKTNEYLKLGLGESTVFDGSDYILEISNERSKDVLKESCMELIFAKLGKDKFLKLVCSLDVNELEKLVTEDFYKSVVVTKKLNRIFHSSLKKEI